MTLYPTPIEAAVAYAQSEGWRVAPVSRGSKVPSVKEWQKVATTVEDTIRGWWRAQPDAGVCIVTGRASGVWVLDVDVADGKQGVESLKALIAEHGGERLPETIAARTPSGGYHYFFTYPADAEVHNSASSRLGPGLDVRGEGGQVNAAPTCRDEGCYRWADGRAPWAAEVLPAPDWLIDLVKDQPKPKPAPPDPLVAPTMTAEAAKQIRDVQKLLSGEPEFVTQYNAAHADWRNVLTGDGWTFAGSDGDVDYWTRPGKEHGISASTNYGDSGLLYVWSTSIDWLPAGRAFDPYGYMARRDFGGDFDAAARRFIEANRAKAAVAPERTGAALPTPVADAPEPVADDEQSRYDALSVDFSPDGPFWNTDFTAEDFLIPPFIARGRGHAFYAPAKAGKSYVALQAVAAACVPDHTSWADSIDEAIRVVWLDYEMTESDLRQRLEAFGYGPHDDYSRLRYVKAAGLGADLDTYDGGQQLLAEALAWSADLVVVDTLSRAVQGEENDADTVRDFYRFTGAPLKDHGIAVVRLDHAGKDSSQGQRGSSGKNDDVDIVWRLEKLDRGARLTLTHSRVFWLPAEILLQNVPGEGDTDAIRHVRTDSDADLTGLDAKARRWADAGWPLDLSRERLRHEHGVEVANSQFSKLRQRVAELRSIDDLTTGPTDGPDRSPRPFAAGTVGPARSGESGPLPAPPIGGSQDRAAAGDE